MISFEEARQIIREHAPDPQGEALVPLAASCGRVLARAIDADLDLPPFDKAMMDGYAVRSADLATAPVELRLVGESRAGGAFDGAVGAGEAVRIMTGAPLPAGADAVAIVERSEELGAERVRLLDPASAEDNVARRGVDLRAGERVLAVGARIGAAEIGVLAFAGCAAVPVYPRLAVHCLATGDELVSHDRRPGAGQIRESNTPAMVAQIASPAVAAQALGRAVDEAGELQTCIARALEGCDLLLLSGGVSVGRYDLVARCLVELGVRQVFHKVRVKPGKPLWFGIRDRDGRPPQLVFGLPGNPVSSFVGVEAFVRPALRRMQGLAGDLELADARLVAGYPIRANQRLQILPAVRIRAGCEEQVRVLEWNSSADLVELPRADALVVVMEQSRPQPGEIVSILPLSAP